MLCHIPLPELQLYSHLDFHSEKMSKIKPPCHKRSREVQQATFRVREKRMVSSNANILSQISMEKKNKFDAFWVIMWFRLDRLRDLLNVNVHVIWAKVAVETMCLKMHPFSGRVCSIRLFETLTTLSSQMDLQTVHLTFLGSEHGLLDKHDEHIGI